MTVSWGHRLGLGLAAAYFVLGVSALWTNQGEPESALLWSGIALVCGAVMLAAGIIGPWDRASVELSLIVCGLLLGIMATLWTLVIPLVAVTVAAVLLREVILGEQAREHRES
jgi:hypothetical protein